MQDEGSFRDPSGHVFARDGRIYRTISDVARADYEHIRDTGALAEAQDSGRWIAAQELPPSKWPAGIGEPAYVLEHPRLPFISYPYEWSFGQLKAAALHHLDLQIALLDRDVVLSDASAYNVQFLGPEPIFIDFLSARPYRKGEFWTGHRQFCDQFLNPLLLRSLCGVAHNAWYRGNLEGISTVDLARLLPLRKSLSFNVLTQVRLQARLERGSIAAPDAAIARAQTRRSLPKSSYHGLLLQMRNWIARLRPADKSVTTWADYSKTHTYTDDEAKAKHAFVADFTKATRPDLLIDVGCNTGDFSRTALQNGAAAVIGFDFDHQALDLAFERACVEKLNFLPLWFDAANPSPSQGWRQSERKGFDQRMTADAMIALAVEHHLAIAKNIPLPQVIDWLVAIAPIGVIEFVPKQDSTIRKMLALREDIFPDYDGETFERLLAARTHIVRSQVVSQSGRTLYWYAR